MGTAVVFVLALVLATFGLLAWIVYELLIRPQQPHFKGKHIHLWLDPSQGLVHIESSLHALTQPLKFGCGQFDFQPLTKVLEKKEWVSSSPDTVRLDAIGRPEWRRGTDGFSYTETKIVQTGRTQVTLTELDPVLYFYSRWQDDATSPSGKQLVSLNLPSTTARALKRWLHAHRKLLTPNEKAIRKTWDSACQTLLNECRRHTSVKGLKKPLEVFSFTSVPAIRYLAIGHGGQVCIKRASSAEVLTLPLDQIQTKGNTLLVPCSDRTTESFKLSSKDIEHLHRIQRHLTKTSARPAQVA